MSTAKHVYLQISSFDIPLVSNPFSSVEDLYTSRINGNYKIVIIM
ncbi:MAG TPA: hypothetical protein VFP49_00500 [Nitrososphaeraceae archaeon]|nr:hypothetical protein [Nitrososphaeraceae archaeon]